ncbi:MAG TPA: AMP-binding protein [Treponemataceae bacterium]|jgi:acetyl-CoA synthetase|nr:AMP-binding protein [Treponemataceae bacterium]
MFLHEFCGREYESYEDLKKNFKINVPDGFNFAFDVVDRYAREEPGKEALVWCDDAGDSRRFSFADLSEASNRAANYLVSLGIGKGDTVMLILKRRYEFWFLLLALHKIGAIAVPATNLLTQKDIEYRNGAAGIKAIVTVADSVVQDRVDAAMAASSTVRRRITIGADRPGWESFPAGFSAASPSFPRPAGDKATKNRDISLLYFTSGTTGYPKMVQHDFTYPLGHIVTARYWQNVADGGLHLTLSETGWAKAMWGKIYGQWLAGCAVFTYDMDTFVPGKFLEKMADYKVTSFCAPPTVYRYLIRENLEKYDLSSLRYCTIAGEPLNPEVYNRFLEKTGIKLFEGYGQTELTLTIGTFPWMEPRPGSMGKPAPGYDIDVVRADGSSCEPGEVGEIVIRIENGKPFGMFAGYYRDDELTKQVFAGGVYHTGDTAQRDEDGYFWFVGRTDDMIKSSGYRIGPFEVESALLTHPAVLECAVTGVPDKDRGQLVKASVVLVKGQEASQALSRELQEHVKRVTAPYKAPRIIDFVPELPKTISGKIRRVEIREGDGA